MPSSSRGDDAATLGGGLGCDLRIAAALFLVALLGCRPTAEERVEPELRVVHVTWPGRPVSDAMQREVLKDPRVVAALRRTRFETVPVGEAGADVRAVLRGTGLVVFDREQPIAVLPGGATARELIAFTGRARAGACALRALRGDPAPAARIATAGWCLELGLPRRALEALPAAPSADRLRIEVDARLTLGDVAGARRALHAAPADSQDPLARARVLLAERRPREAAAILEDIAGGVRSDRIDFWLAIARLEVDDRAGAYPILERLAAGAGAFAARARQRLGLAITGGHGHTHR